MADDNNAAVNYAMIAGNMYGPNPYTKFQGRLPSMTTRGPATDAMGRPIASYDAAQTAHDAWDKAHPPSPPGTTLNKSGQTYGLQYQDLAAPSALNPSGNLAFGMANWGGMMSPQARGDYANASHMYPGGVQQAMQQGRPGVPGMPGQQAAPQAAPETNPIDMTQAYMDALANPGDIRTLGANVPASQPVSQQPSVLDQFLAGQKGGQGAGGYSNTGFFDTLNRLRGNSLTGEGADQSAAPSINPGAGMGDMFAQLGGNPPPGTPGAPKDIATQGFLDANGRPTAALGQLAQGWGDAQRRLVAGG